VTLVTERPAFGGYCNRMAQPTLWHIPASHYSEKVRWALALKGVEHRRVAPPPGVHMVLAPLLTRGRHFTLPVLSLDGRRIGDSTAIIAALEERFPQPPLYPEDPAERARALALEDYFDETAAPAVRQLGWHVLRSDRERFDELAAAAAPRPLARFAPAIGTYARALTAVRFKAADASEAERSRAAVRGALDRLEAELGGGDYLVGDRFSVADLTAAALLYPLAMPPGAPLSKRPPPALARLREEFGADRPAVAWVAEMYRRHRRPARRAAAGAGAAAA
jgi:glutathione S-transferase